MHSCPFDGLGGPLARGLAAVFAGGVRGFHSARWTPFGLNRLPVATGTLVRPPAQSGDNGVTPRHRRSPGVSRPLPARVETLTLRPVWVVVAVNLVGTLFGVWYYRFQLQNTALVMSLVVHSGSRDQLLTRSDQNDATESVA